jgi:hypothetical protein
MRLSTVTSTILLYLEAVQGHHYHYMGHIYLSGQVEIITDFTKRIYVTVFAYNLSNFASLIIVYVEAAIFQ